MTALCGGGTSRPKAGVAETIIFTSSQLGSFLNNKGGLWATLAVGALGVLTYQATSLCDTDPPPAPTLTAADYNALLQLGPSDQLATALAKLKDLVTNAVWYELCECSATATPPPPAGLLNPPTGVTLPDFGLTPCASPTLRANVRPGVNAAGPAQNVTEEMFPNLRFATSVATDADHPAERVAQIPSTWTSSRGSAQLISGTTPTTAGYSMVFSTYGADLRFSRQPWIVVATTAAPYDQEPVNGPGPFGAADVYFSVHVGSHATVTNPGVVDYGIDINCSGPTTTQPGCCQDPVATALLNEVLQQVRTIREDTDLLQRYVLPFAYVPGAVHSSLSEVGSASIGRSIGLRVEVTTFPGGNKQLIGTPPYIYDLGWISVLTPDGLLDEIRLTRQHTTWMSKLIPSATQMGWGLREGVTVNVTELRAEA